MDIRAEINVSNYLNLRVGNKVEITDNELKLNFEHEAFQGLITDYLRSVDNQTIDAFIDIAKELVDV